MIYFLVPDDIVVYYEYELSESSDAKLLLILLHVWDGSNFFRL